ncbi:MAG: phosphohistidine phosphatase SixA [Acidobacteriota bacterium]
MVLYFIRHGEAGTVAPSDFERTLTMHGKAEADGVGRALKLLVGRAHSIFASPIIRAQQTASIIRSHLGTAPIEPCEHLTPGADPRNLFAELKHCTNDSNVLLVGHEPFLSTCVSTLVSGQSDARILFRPATVACVSVGPVIERGAGRLDWLMNAEQMARLAPGT